MPAHLADVLQDCDDALEISNVEYWQLQVNVTIVANAVRQRLSAHIAVGIFLTGTLDEDTE